MQTYLCLVKYVTGSSTLDNQLKSRYFSDDNVKALYGLATTSIQLKFKVVPLKNVLSRF